MKDNFPTCASCEYEPSERFCVGIGKKAPSNCPTLRHGDLIKKATAELEDPELLNFSRESSLQEAACYANRHDPDRSTSPLKPRILETMEFAERLGVKRLGLAFCIGLRNEAAAVEDIFKRRGLEVVSVACKAGKVPKTTLGVEPDDFINPLTDETMCNPILQAKLLNEHGCKLNVLLGLCVGHDSLFIKYCEGFVTVLAAKDRLMGHNPLAAVYNSGSYYRYLKDGK